ncbi:MAG: hypothetical protein WD572_10925 [Gammaproteobacteria bacterium]
MSNYSAQLYGILSASLFWLALLTFIVGLLMLLVPGWLLRVSERMNLWIDTSIWFKKLDEQRRFERLFYRHHIIMGSLIVVGSLYSLWFLWRLYGGDELRLLVDIENWLLEEILNTTLSMLLVIGNIFALLTGLIVVLRPSLIKGLEAWSNRWVESDRVFRTLDKQLDLAEQIIPGHPRLFGLLVVLGSLYIMSNTVISAFPA